MNSGQRTLQVVYVRDAHPRRGLIKVGCGTIVEILNKRYPACLVEFIDDDGATLSRGDLHTGAAPRHAATSVSPCRVASSQPQR